MCLSLPGRVVTVEEGRAQVERDGRRTWFNALLQPGLQPGDWVLTHTGLVLDVIEEAEARAIEAALSEPPASSW